MIFGVPMMKSGEPRFEPNAALNGFSDRDWMEMTEETFKQVFGKSAVKRAKFTGLKRNLDFLKQERKL
jgi:epoxyqueuosine reductase